MRASRSGRSRTVSPIRVAASILLGSSFARRSANNSRFSVARPSSFLALLSADVSASMDSEIRSRSAWRASTASDF